MSAEKTTPLQPQRPQRSGGVLLADNQDSATAYKKGVAYQAPPTLPATSSPRTGPVGGNGANPMAAPSAAGLLKCKRGQTVVYDAVPLAVAPPSPPAAASAAAAAAAHGAGAPSLAAATRPQGFSSGPAGGRAKSRSAPPRAPPASDVVLLRKRALPPQKEAEGSVTPVLKTHVIKVQTGEDVVSKLMSFSQNGCAVWVDSANGDVSNVTLHQAASAPSSTVKYEGCFKILRLAGSYLLSESDDLSRRTGVLSVALAGLDGHILGGRVAGSLTAASPVQVVCTSFAVNPWR
ncbi:hypothetical protein ABZP36_010382 [Zizania latifolia]